MRIDFTKMHGLGNDFMIFDAPAKGGTLPTPPAWRRLSDRHRGIGFDQALVLEPPRRADTLAFYRIFNADGSEVEQCGNGARCIAALLARRGTAPIGQQFIMDSPGGLVRARVLEPAIVAVDMGIPDFAPRALPFDASAESPLYPLDVADVQVNIGAVSLGNPHAVLTVASTETAPVATLGPAIESHHRFPKRVNVGFMEILDRGHIRLRVFERGSGETLACGTGACAAVAVGRHDGRLNDNVSVLLPGGELRVNWPGRGEHIWMTGPAQVAYEGHVDL